MNQKISDNFHFFPIQLQEFQGRQALYICNPFNALLTVQGLVVQRKSSAVFDGVMTSLYERELHPFVGGKQLSLKLVVTGHCKLTLFHRSATGNVVEYGMTKTTLPMRSTSLEVMHPITEDIEIYFSLNASEQNFGRWYFSLEAFDDDVVIHKADWCVKDVKLTEVKPAIVICTFKREAQVTNNVSKLVGILSSVTNIFGILIVDNAKTLTRDPTWPDSVRVIKQRNVGGAGGFGRGIHEVVSSSAFTHIVLLDDDADIDPVSIIRLINLFRLSCDDQLFVGGLQFDTYCQTCLADAGAYWTPERFEKPITRLAPCDLSVLDSKDGLAHPKATNFNGWWLFGGRTEAFRRFGMPLPCFVHLDDVEFGVRVYLKGGKTLSIPGIAVWHEPYYAKLEGWFAYYNIRNELIRLSMQAPLLLRSVAEFVEEDKNYKKRAQETVKKTIGQLRHRFIEFINSYQYGSAALLLKAIEDFLTGPEIILNRDAEKIHISVIEEYKKFNANYLFLSSLPIGYTKRVPKRGGKLYRLVQSLIRNGNRFDLTFLNPARRVTIFRTRNDINWRAVRCGKEWGYYDPASPGLHLYRCDPNMYAALSSRSFVVFKKFAASAAEAQVSWSDSYDKLVSFEFWSSLIATF